MNASLIRFGDPLGTFQRKWKRKMEKEASEIKWSSLDYPRGRVPIFTSSFLTKTTKEDISSRPRVYSSTVSSPVYLFFISIHFVSLKLLSQIQDCVAFITKSLLLFLLVFIKAIIHYNKSFLAFYPNIYLYDVWDEVWILLAINWSIILTFILFCPRRVKNNSLVNNKIWSTKTL